MHATKQETRAAVSSGTHRRPLEAGDGGQEGSEFFGLWSAAQHPWSVLALSYLREKIFSFLFFKK